MRQALLLIFNTTTFALPITMTQIYSETRILTNDNLQDDHLLE